LTSARVAVLTVIVIPVALFVGLPVSRYLSSNQETLTLDDNTRHSAGGSFVRLPGGVTHYELGGPAGGTTLLLINGFSTPYNIWDPTFEGLTHAGVRVLRYDLFGRGWSDRPDAAYDATMFVAQAADLLDALGIREPVDIGGVSMGGPIAVTFAARYPGRVRRVLLFDPGYFPGFDLQFSMSMPVVGEYNMAVRLAPGMPQSQWADFEHPERYPHYLDPYVEQMRYKGFRRAILRTLRNYVSKDSSGDYRTLGASGKPVLLIWGKDDKDTPIALSTTIRNLVPQAEFHVIADAAHIPHYEHPELVNPMVLEFLRR
jgi:pimeloyl-ACP methyl ester carboxylesterase